MWVRGLKRINEQITNQIRRVASYVGAWIETSMCTRASLTPPVASYVGAWIETTLRTPLSSTIGSHPMWVRGLKLCLIFSK